MLYCVSIMTESPALHAVCTSGKAMHELQTLYDGKGMYCCVAMPMTTALHDQDKSSMDLQAAF